LGKQCFAQLVVIEEFAKLPDGRRFGHRLTPRSNLFVLQSLTGRDMGYVTPVSFPLLL
jgi:hypothetical protein